MKKLSGNSLNFRSSVLGRITTHYTSHFFSNKNILLLSDSHRKIFGNYKAIITKVPTPVNSKLPQVYNALNADSLCDGDIVLIDSDGTVNVLYEKNSNDNCLFLTESCNCSCIMCPQPRIVSEDSKIGINCEIVSLIDRKTKRLGLSGGEPTLLNSGLVNIINLCKKCLPETKLDLLTNGIKFEDLDYVKMLAGVNNRNVFFEIPIYADTDVLHNKIIGANGFYKTIKGLYNLALCHQKVNLRIVIHKLNYKRLPQLADFIYHNFPFVYHIAFMQMEMFGMARKNAAELWIDPFDYNEQLMEATTYLAFRDMDVSIYNAQLCVLPKSIRRFARQSISAWKNVYLRECDECLHKRECGGFFATSEDMYSKHIIAIKSIDN